LIIWLSKIIKNPKGKPIGGVRMVTLRLLWFFPGKSFPDTGFSLRLDVGMRTVFLQSPNM